MIKTKRVFLYLLLILFSLNIVFSEGTITIHIYDPYGEGGNTGSYHTTFPEGRFQKTTDLVYQEITGLSSNVETIKPTYMCKFGGQYLTSSEMISSRWENQYGFPFKTGNYSLYYCQTIKDFINKIYIPETWKNSNLVLYCNDGNSINLESENFDYFISKISNLYKGCILKNLDLNENNTIFYGLEIGNVKLDNNPKYFFSKYETNTLTSKFNIYKIEDVNLDNIYGTESPRNKLESIAIEVNYNFISYNCGSPTPTGPGKIIKSYVDTTGCTICSDHSSSKQNKNSLNQNLNFSTWSDLSEENNIDLSLNKKLYSYLDAPGNQDYTWNDYTYYCGGTEEYYYVNESMLLDKYLSIIDPNNFINRNSIEYSQAFIEKNLNKGYMKFNISGNATNYGREYFYTNNYSLVYDSYNNIYTLANFKLNYTQDKLVKMNEVFNSIPNDFGISRVALFRKIGNKKIYGYESAAKFSVDDGGKTRKAIYKIHFDGISNIKKTVCNKNLNYYKISNHLQDKINKYNIIECDNSNIYLNSIRIDGTNSISSSFNLFKNIILELKK